MLLTFLVLGAAAGGVLAGASAEFAGDDVLATFAHAGAPRPSRLLDVRPDFRAGGRPLARGLVGLSVEWPVLARDLGPHGLPSRALADALRALGRPPLRIGGNSQDRMWPIASGMPTGAVWAPPPAFWRGLARLDAAAAGTVTVGLDLAHADPWAAQAVVDAARRALPPGRVAFSLGNEPDRFGVQRWARLGPRRVITARPRSWTFAQYLRQYDAMRSRIAGLGPLTGPDFADPGWRPHLEAFVRAERLRAVDVHAYPLNVCHKHPGTKGWPTTRALLAPSSWAGEVRRGISWAIADARRARLPLVVSEANSVACTGARGVSDTHAAALWGLAFVLSAAQAGASEVDLHASGSWYDPFRVVPGPGGRVAVQPSALFDGLVFAQRFAGGGTRLLPLHATPRGAPAWAVRGPGGDIRVLVENLDLRHRRVARIALPTATAAVGVSRLAPAARTAAGSPRMAIDGQTLVERGGRLVALGTRTATQARAVHGHVRLVLPPLSAVALTVPGL